MASINSSFQKENWEIFAFFFNHEHTNGEETVYLAEQLSILEIYDS